MSEISTELTQPPSPEDVEVIDKPAPKQKNPKKVAAGKKLAENNRIMREQHAQLLREREERESSQAEKTPSTDPGWFKKSVIIVGVCVVAGYILYNQKPERPDREERQDREGRPERPKPVRSKHKISI